MTDSCYKIITIIGTSPESWEKAAKAAVEMAAKTLRDVRIAEIVELDLKVENGKTIAYRAKVNLSFRIEREEEALFHKEPYTWNFEKEHPSFDG